MAAVLALLLAGCTGSEQGAAGGTTSGPAMSDAVMSDAARSDAAMSDAATSAATRTDGTPAGGAGGTTTSGTEPPVPTIEDWRAGVRFTDVAVDAALRTNESIWTAIGAVSAGPGHPAIVGSIRQQVDQPRTLAVWADTAQGWQPTSVPMEGSVISASLAGSADLLVVAGARWQEGRARPFLTTSVDGTTWSAQALPASLDRMHMVAVSVDAGRVVALGTDTHDRAVLVRTAPGAPVETTDLPEPPAGSRHRLCTVLLSGTTVIVAGYEGPEFAGDKPPVVHVSTDGGRTVGAAQLVTGDVRAAVRGVVPVPGGFVATGFSAETLAADADLRPAAWFSVNGIAWSQEKLPGSLDLPDGDAGSEEPLGTGTEVTATVWAEGSLSAAVLVRRPEGRWMLRGHIGPMRENGVSGLIVRADAGSGNAGVDRLAVAVDGPQGVVLGHLNLGVWTPDLTPTLSENLFSVAHTLPGEVPRIRLERWRTRQEGGYWSRGTEDAIAAWDPTAGLRPDTFDPPEAAGRGGLQTADDPDSDAQQVGTSAMDTAASGMTVRGWFRAAPGQPWQPWQGFGADGYEKVSAVHKVAGAWYAAGQRAVTADYAEPRQAMLWSSTDGITWTRADGDFAAEALTSSIATVCEATDGSPVAVGWRDDPAGGQRPTVWTRGADGRWLAAYPAVPDRASGWADGCTEQDGMTVLTGTIGQTPARWTQDPGGTWGALPAQGADGKPYDENAAAESRRDGAVDVPGGKAATGFLDTAEHFGPVLWLSADGESWAWVPLPTATTDVRQVILPVDGGLVVAASTDVGISAWRLDDTAALISAMPPG